MEFRKESGELDTSIYLSGMVCGGSFEVIDMFLGNISFKVADEGSAIFFRK